MTEFLCEYYSKVNAEHFHKQFVSEVSNNNNNNNNNNTLFILGYVQIKINTK